MSTPFDRARDYDAEAATVVLSKYYPQVVRMAHALAGDQRPAMRVVQFVMSRSIRILPKCRDEEALQRWLYHHTLLSARGFTQNPPDAKADLLAVFGGGSDANSAAYAAFVRALRGLPQQQREALLLHHGEHLNARYLGIAMDCSAVAAENHLRAANASMIAVAGAESGTLLNQLAQAYARLKPREDVIVPMTRKYVTGYLRPRRLMRWIRAIVALAVLAGLAWLGWRYGVWGRISQLIHR